MLLAAHSTLLAPLETTTILTTSVPEAHRQSRKTHFQFLDVLFLSAHLASKHYPSTWWLHLTAPKPLTTTYLLPPPPNSYCIFFCLPYFLLFASFPLSLPRCNFSGCHRRSFLLQLQRLKRGNRFEYATTTPQDLPNVRTTLQRHASQEIPKAQANSGWEMTMEVNDGRKDIVIIGELTRGADCFSCGFFCVPHIPGSNLANRWL